MKFKSSPTITSCLRNLGTVCLQKVALNHSEWIKSIVLNQVKQDRPINNNLHHTDPGAMSALSIKGFGILAYIIMIYDVHLISLKNTFS